MSGLTHTGNEHKPFMIQASEQPDYRSTPLDPTVFRAFLDNFWLNQNFSKENPCSLFTPIFSQIHAKFHKNSCISF